MTHQQRVIEEFNELGKKLIKLYQFMLHSEVYSTIQLSEQELLSEQAVKMQDYYNILEKRISTFSTVAE